MTFDKSTRDGTPDSTIHPTNSKQDLAALASILAQCGDDPAESADGSQPQVAELLEHITTVDNIAKGVEERLDGVIEDLNLLLSTLEQDSENQQPPQAGAVVNGKGDKQPSS
jgi:hypothetical protein